MLEASRSSSVSWFKHDYDSAKNKGTHGETRGQTTSSASSPRKITDAAINSYADGGDDRYPVPVETGDRLLTHCWKCCGSRAGIHRGHHRQDKTRHTNKHKNVAMLSTKGQRQQRERVDPVEAIATAVPRTYSVRPFFTEFKGHGSHEQ